MILARLAILSISPFAAIFLELSTHSYVTNGGGLIRASTR